MAPGFAQEHAALSTTEILQQIEALRADQARIAEMQRQTDASIRALEEHLQIQRPASSVNTATAAAPISNSAPVSASAQTPATADRLKVGGDLRLRAQRDSATRDLPGRYGSSIRARLGAAYAVSDRITIGGRLVTGNPDDPNSTDVQLSNFDDNLEVSLDQAYVQLNLDNLKVYGGKIPQIFSRTDLVWDGDVNPQGAAAAYKTPLGNGGAFRANGMLFVIDKPSGKAASSMVGAQFGYDSPTLAGDWKYDVSAAYYQYRMGSMFGADAGDWRSNLLRPDGMYLSEFKLVDVIASVTYQGFGERWPLRIAGDYVRNLGAYTNDDTGFGIDLALGNTSRAGNWRFGYGYAQTQVDAVMAAFSQDNIGLATNYKLHTLTADYALSPKAAIQGIWYHYKPLSARYAGTHDPKLWQDRLRLALLINF